MEMFALLLLTLVFAIAMPLVVVATLAWNTAPFSAPVRAHRVRPALIAIASSNRLPRPPRA
jgi:hypothetical protein